MSNADVYYNNAAMIDRLTAAACENAELKAERNRLRHQNADLLGQLDAVVFVHNVIQSERDRLQEALDHALKGDLDLEDRVLIAQIIDGTALQEDKDDD